MQYVWHDSAGWSSKVCALEYHRPFSLGTSTCAAFFTFGSNPKIFSNNFNRKAGLQFFASICATALIVVLSPAGTLFSFST